MCIDIIFYCQIKFIINKYELNKKGFYINFLMIGKKILKVMLKNLLRHFKIILKKRKIFELCDKENKFVIWNNYFL